MTVRSGASLTSQLREIERKSLLSRVDRMEIEKRLSDKLNGEQDDGAKDVDDDDADDGDMVDIVNAGDKILVGNGDNEDDRVDIRLEVGDRNKNGGGNADVDSLGQQVEMEVGDEVLVEVEAVDTWNGVSSLRVLTEEERGVLGKLREVFYRNDCVVVPSMKAQDGRKVMKEVRQKLDEGLEHIGKQS